MKTRPLLLSMVLVFSVGILQADRIELQPGEMGYYWYQKSTWLGGSDTTTGFDYGDAQGKQHVQTNYQYYGGSDRFWQQKDLYFQIDLAAITEPLTGPATFNFYMTDYASSAESFLKHLGVQTTAATGDAGQKLAGDGNVAGTGTFVLGWNSLDVTPYIQSDLTNGYAFAAFSIPKFGQVQDQNRILSLYGPGSTVEVEGAATRPYLEFSTVPEPSALLLLSVGLLCLVVARTSSRV